ncbi:MAG: outer membrane protein transport protein [Synergistaceae bacterium]|nr:outer membrane protein transport protein [Candidatus Equadaptatus faecalis]
MKKILAVVLLVSLLVPAAAFAEGFGVYEWSATGTAMGDNFMFDEEDAAVLAYNPAGITHLKGKHLSFGATWFNPAIKCHFQNTPSVPAYNWKSWNEAKGYKGTTHKNNSYDPVWAGSIFYTHQLNDKHWLGLGVFPRFGNGINFDSTWEGRYDTVSGKITGITIQPTWAFKPSEKWSIALGLDVNYMNLSLSKQIPIHDGAKPLPNLYGDALLDLDGKCTNLGWFVSAMYDFDKKNSAAITYRSSIKHTMDADTEVISDLGNQYANAHGSVTVPDSLSFGFGHKFSDRTRIEFDATWTNWSTYDVLDMSFTPAIQTPTGPMDNYIGVKDWKAAWRFGVGFQHRMNSKWTFLCGYNFDGSPVPDETFDFTVPTGDRHRGSVGFKYNISRDAAITFAYTAIWAASRDVESKVGGADFTSARINDCLTQILSLGFSMKLK